jgi:exopolysaccharide biosynthesis WecB/TagA/CpsF family protein
MDGYVDFLNIRINNFTFDGFLNHLREGVVFTTNVDHLMKLQKDEEFYQVYKEAEYVVCDSRIVMWSSLLLKQKIRQQIAGSDLLPAFCRYHRNNSSIKIFLLGGTEISSKLAKEEINRKTNSQIVVDQYSPPFGFEYSQRESRRIIDRVNRSRATVLSVGVGAPKQEKWIVNHRHLMPNVKIFLAVGATIEFESGLLSRAPRWMSRVGAEWVFRLAREPKRLWRRYLLEGPPFFVLVLKQCFGLYSNPWHAGDMTPTIRYKKIG